MHTVEIGPRRALVLSTILARVLRRQELVDCEVWVLSDLMAELRHASGTVTVGDAVQGCPEPGSSGNSGKVCKSA